MEACSLITCYLELNATSIYFIGVHYPLKGRFASAGKHTGELVTSHTIDGAHYVSTLRLKPGVSVSSDIFFSSFIIIYFCENVLLRREKKSKIIVF
jgi:hypothetical protein